jgi:hypothetical protein
MLFITSLAGAIIGAFLRDDHDRMRFLERLRSALKQRMIGERFGGLDEGLVSRMNQSFENVSGYREAKYLSRV